ncbi:modulator protein [Erythrobacter sp. QSSC1-22B]|uniref:TldD/PmbA family protein n=1 Tax=Erythrobacter sp. QSSC1-22B TaxID=1860125 RepID=UPI000805446F|nr:TldD/PmbA family protein [Erythrobacter sp. QSSC1-22B]OBX19773.1 modulator protein [Erythrobacter sp. QSSC1-22B]
MIDAETAIARCADLVETARRLGADAADAVTRAEASESVAIRLGKLEEVERSEGESIGLRVMVGQRSASIQTSDFSRASFEELAERALTMARLAPEDSYSGLAPQDRLFTGEIPDFDMRDSHEPSPETLREAALEAEDAARAVTGVTNSNGGSASFSQSVAALVTSHGFARGYEATGHSLSASVVAGEGNRMQTDYDYRTARHRADLPTPASIGAEAGRRTVAKLDPVSMPSGPLPVVFDPRVGGGLIGHLLGAMSGPAVARKSSFLLGKEDDELFDPAIRILEDPHRLRGLRSRPFDGEGLPTVPRALVENGRIFGWLTNSASARQLDAPLSGHAARGGGGSPGVSASNIHLAPGTMSRDELIADIEDGVLITSVFGQGVNMITGDYSRGANGFRIIDGRIVGPVAEITIAGNLLAMFRALVPANDLEMLHAVNVPTLRVDGMTVAGE